MEKNYGQISTSAIVIAVLAFVLGIAIGWFVKSSQVVTSVPSSVTQTQQSGGLSQPQLNLNKDMRKLWEDHITWTRMYLISEIYGNTDVNNVTQRLLKNQEDIGNAIKPFYGEDAGNKLTDLLKTHIVTAADLVKAAKANNQNALSTADTKWYQNADEIADFLSSANPNWPKDTMRIMMKEHLDLTKQEALDILDKKYDANIADYDRVHEQILKMADMLTEGIIKQFPDKVR